MKILTNILLILAIIAVLVYLGVNMKEDIVAPICERLL